MTNPNTTTTPRPDRDAPNYYPAYDPYHCHGAQFTSREVDQVVRIIREWSAGNEHVSAGLSRAMTRRVRRWAQQDAQLMALGPSRWAQNGRQRLCYLQLGRALDMCWDVPLEAVWRIVRGMLREDSNGALSAGYSITSHADWAALNIWPATNRHYSARDLAEQERILGRLAERRYIIFQQAGSVWAITEGHI